MRGVPKSSLFTPRQGHTYGFNGTKRILKGASIWKIPASRRRIFATTKGSPEKSGQSYSYGC